MTDLPDGAATCAHCGAKVERPAPFAEAVSQAEPAPVPQPATTEAPPQLADPPVYRVENSLTGIGGWLILVAIQLATGPIFCMYGMFLDFRVLYGASYETHLASHHAVAVLVLFEAATNTLALQALCGLNFLFYSRKKSFPKLMITYIAARTLFVIVDHVSAVALFGHGSASPMLRYLVYAVIWIPYLMNSIRVEQTFTR
jgi:hypothetical protein